MFNSILFIKRAKLIFNLRNCQLIKKNIKICNFSTRNNLFKEKEVNWNESQTLVHLKSKFQGRCVEISSLEDVPRLLNCFMESHSKILSNATHPMMYAWRTGTVSCINSGKFFNIINLNQGCHDNNEAGAGARILGLLERTKLVNVLVIVSRWYGGTPLGPARFRDITEVATQSLKKGLFLDENNSPIYKLNRNQQTTQRKRK
ncbi:hypothetical protein PACTADRAFT_50969 [Pachysolen tannophilus NRRL Y-2460]|uniref:Impact N-terminal domain-containing protein n=1 Tax=Pachysolen tannophilus NRRL Y-2460 TaxID=669874 RepID=A0A1E4TQQ5_PACTA|nr:hypothetical protein PACTADRAFT_50969 [Pachysolen tannophilus NRRL Y-2460]